MQDRYRFRVWSPRFNEYLESEDYQYEYCRLQRDGELDLVGEVGKDYIIEQCTGLKDIHKALIFEGDKFGDHYVVWRKGCWCVTKYGSAGMLLKYYLKRNPDAEITGNVHEVEI